VKELASGRDGYGAERKSRWVPSVYLDQTGTSGRLKCDYVVTELNVAQGERLEIIGEESGWFWCRKETGENGWVPAENIELNHF